MDINPSLKELIEKIEKSGYKYASLISAKYKDNTSSKDWLNYATKIYLFKGVNEGEIYTSNAGRDYILESESFKFEYNEIDIAELLNKLSHPMHGLGLKTIRECKFLRKEPSALSGLRCFSEVYDITDGHRPKVKNQIIRKYGEPLINFETAVEWGALDIIGLMEPSRVLIYLTNTEVQIENIAFDEERKKVNIQYSVSENCPSKNIDIRLNYSSESGELQTPNRIVRTEKGIQNVKIDLFFKPKTFLIDIIDEFDNLLDFYDEDMVMRNKKNYTSLSNLNVLEEFENLLTRIENGETNITEFKDSIDIYDKNKTREVLQTAVAFANHIGGKIFIGITDKGEVIGVKSTHLAKIDKNSQKKAREQYGDYFKRRIVNELTRSVKPQIKWHSIYGKNVLEIDIKMAKGCQIRPTNESWIRCNATNRRPNETELKLLFAIN